VSIEIVELDESWQSAAVRYLRRSPYRNAIPLSNVTQLRQHCRVLVAHYQGLIQGVVSYYRDLAFPALSFSAEPGTALPALLRAIADREPALTGEPVVSVLPEQRALQLAQYVRIESLLSETQMVVEPETLRPRHLANVRRLRDDDLPGMHELAVAESLMAWRPSVITHGPAFGAFIGERLAAMACTHFATPDVIEIGNVVTHPDYRRRGLASACISALTEACFGLADRVYLLVVNENDAAITGYRRLGFWPAERFTAASFRLDP
jgi:ribosomal protein S18 acetylase RimI-like enzyme